MHDILTTYFSWLADEVMCQDEAVPTDPPAADPGDAADASVGRSLDMLQIKSVCPLYSVSLRPILNKTGKPTCRNKSKPLFRSICSHVWCHCPLIAVLATDAAGTAAAPHVTAAPDVGADRTATAGREHTTLVLFTVRNIDINADNQDGGASGTITMADDKPDKGVSDVPAIVPDNSPNVKVVVVSKLQVSCSHGAFPVFDLKHWHFLLHQTT